LYNGIKLAILSTHFLFTASFTVLKRLLKQILALPNSVADIAVYILTGILPIEAQMHIRAFITMKSTAK
jgi:hypothetical protein